MPNYRLAVFEELVSLLERVLVVFGQPDKHESLSNGSIPDPEHFVKVRNYHFGGSSKFFYTCILAKVMKYRPRIIITPFHLGNLDLYMLFIMRMFLRYKLVVWSHGWNRRKGFQPEGFKDKLRVAIMRQADAVLLYSEGAKRKIAEFVPSSKIFVASNTLQTEDLRSIAETLEEEGREQVKRHVGFVMSYNLIFLGRLEANKRPEILVRMLQILQKEIPSIGLHFVGDGRMRATLEIMVEKAKVHGVVFHGTINDESTLGKLLFSSDLMITPAAVGLAIVHGFCFGCPILTAAGVGHGPEIDYLSNNKNGFIVSSCDELEMARIALGYLKDFDTQKRMRAEAIRTAEQEASISRMISGFSALVQFLGLTASHLIS